MLSVLSTENLARASASRPKRTVAIWFVAIVAAFVAIATLFDGTMTTKFYFYGNPDSKRADELLESRLRGPDDVNEVVIVRSATMTVDEDAYQEHVFRDIRRRRPARHRYRRLGRKLLRDRRRVASLG